MMMTLSQRMQSLILLAETFLGNPHTFHGSDTFQLIAAEIRAFHALPAEDIRRTHAPMAMLHAIEGALQQQGTSGGSMPWRMVIGALLPLLKEETYRQWTSEKETARG